MIEAKFTIKKNSHWMRGVKVIENQSQMKAKVINEQVARHTRNAVKQEGRVLEEVMKKSKEEEERRRKEEEKRIEEEAEKAKASTTMEDSGVTTRRKARASAAASLAHTTGGKKKEKVQMLLLYPPPPNDYDAVVLCESDLGRLVDGEYLNDSLIDFYMKYLQFELLPTYAKRAIMASVLEMHPEIAAKAIRAKQSDQGKGEEQWKQGNGKGEGNGVLSSCGGDTKETVVAVGGRYFTADVKEKEVSECATEAEAIETPQTRRDILHDTYIEQQVIYLFLVTV